MSLAALAINEFACLCVPDDFGTATETGLDLKL